MAFTLEIAFTNAQLETFFATGANVIVAKPDGGGSPNVAWQVFKPFQNNQVSWQEQYGFFASTATATPGTSLPKLSSIGIPIAENKLYTLEESAIISGPASGGSPNAFAILNRYSALPYLTMGLYADATVNGTEIAGNALSAALVPLASTVTMTPSTTVYIWMQSEVVSNFTLGTVTSPMTKLVFSNGMDTISVAYDSNSGKFLPASASVEFEYAYLEASL